MGRAPRNTDVVIFRQRPCLQSRVITLTDDSEFIRDDNVYYACFGLLYMRTSPLSISFLL